MIDGEATPFMLSDEEESKFDQSIVAQQIFQELSKGANVDTVGTKILALFEDCKSEPEGAAINEDKLVNSILSQLHTLVSDHQDDLDQQEQKFAHDVKTFKGHIERLNEQIEVTQNEVSILDKQ